jgi:hypothetical protein
MKNYKLSFKLLLCVMFFSGLKNSHAQQFKYGVRAGFNASNVSLKNVNNRGERYGYHAGGFVEIPLIKNFMDLNPELSYSLKGTTFEILNQKRKLNMNYVDLFLPLSFKLKEIDLQVGPFASYLISKPTYKIGKEAKIAAEGFKKYDSGLSIGLNYNFELFFIALRYNQGFVNLNNSPNNDFLGNGKSAVGQVSIGYKF